MGVRDAFPLQACQNRNWLDWQGSLVTGFGVGAVLPTPGRGLRRPYGPPVQRRRGRVHLQDWRWAVPWRGNKTPVRPAPSGCSNPGRGCTPASSRPGAPQSAAQRTRHPPTAYVLRLRPAAPHDTAPFRRTAIIPVFPGQRNPASSHWCQCSRCAAMQFPARSPAASPAPR